MNKIFLAITVLLTISACKERKPYTEHQVKLDVTDKDCDESNGSFKMISNFGGERYEFQKCLPPNYTNDGITSERRGDTVVVHFDKEGREPGNKIYNVILDIDSYPRYHVLAIDGDVYAITEVKK